MAESTEHTRSYYAATAREQTAYPALVGEHDCDVAIVGGGFTGVAAALRLSELGYSVGLVESARIGWGASGRNGGQLIDNFIDVKHIRRKLGSRAAELAAVMNVECRNILVDNIERYGIECDLRFGFLDLATKPKDVVYLRNQLQAKQQDGYPHRLEYVEGAELAKHIGSRKYVGALVNHGNGHLHPLDLCVGEARAAAGLGARLFEQSRATRIVHGAKPAVETEHGVLRADKVILAGNAYLGSTEPRLAGLVVPAGTYMIATEPLSADLADELLPQNAACCDQRIGLDYFRLSPDRRMLFGALCNYSGRRPKDITATIRQRMENVFPQLRGVAVDYEWGGDIAISVIRVPQLGRVSENVLYAQGYSGHGVAPTHLAGHILAETIEGNEERFNVFSRMKHWRLPGGKWFANPALAIGMGYYRLKDLF